MGQGSTESKDMIALGCLDALNMSPIDSPLIRKDGYTAGICRSEGLGVEV